MALYVGTIGIRGLRFEVFNFISTDFVSEKY